MDLARKPEVARLIVEEVAKINATLPATTKIRRIVLLNKELEADDAEMTRTRKVRRAFVAEKYAPVIKALYDGAKETAAHHGHHLRGRPQEPADDDAGRPRCPPARRRRPAWRRERGRWQCGSQQRRALDCHPGACPRDPWFSSAPSGSRIFDDHRPQAFAPRWVPGDKAARDDARSRPKERVMWDEIQFAFALAVSGLSIGLMYSLIALGFVLVYKATDAINFAQGEFVMLAGFVAALVARRQGHARHGRASLPRWRS